MVELWDSVSWYRVENAAPTRVKSNDGYQNAFA